MPDYIQFVHVVSLFQYTNYLPFNYVSQICQILIWKHIEDEIKELSTFYISFCYLFLKFHKKGIAQVLLYHNNFPFLLDPFWPPALLLYIFRSKNKHFSLFSFFILKLNSTPLYLRSISTVY